MDLLHIIVLALIQGLTEFVPISSSAHLILPSQLLGWEDQGLAFDVAVHVGSLAAVLVYFRKEVINLLQGWLTTGFSKTPSADGKLAWYIIIATLPAVVFGLLLSDWIEANLRSTQVIAWSTIGFGILLGLSDRVKNHSYNMAQLTLFMVLVIGFSQAIALIPGTSRSGITITAALFLGLHRVDAARFSFLLSIPLIVAAGSYQTLKLVQSAMPVNWSDMVLGVVLSAISAWICIHYFLVFINRIGMMPFVIYRLVLGGILLLLPFLV